VFGKNTLEEAMAVTRKMTLAEAAKEITCPLLVVHGENDRQIPLWHAEKTIETAINCKDKELKVFHLADGGAEHCGADNGSLIIDYITDWVAERLGANVAGI
jgi:dipeptidyl aminopeptidase/acylaminoacyl peptidase